MDSSKQSKNSLPSIHWLKLRAEGQWPRIVTSLCKIAPEQLDGRKQPCPLCGGADRFRAFRDFEEKGGVVCSHCHNKRNADGLATVAWLNGWPFPQTMRAVAEFLGEIPPGKEVSPPSQHKRTATSLSHLPAKPVEPDRPHPASALKFLPWNASLAALWCLKKRPVTPAALERIGARLARYHDSLIVIAIPIWGPQLQQADPVGWLLFNATGGDLPSKDGPVSKKITWGSDTGVIGMVDRLRDRSARKIKTEGPTDLLSLLSVNPQTTDCIICNACGANEHPEKKMPWLGQMVAGAKVVTVHDRDQAGQDGLERWSNFFAATAAESRAVTLPFEFE